MSAQYNVSMQLSAQNGDDYGIDDGYPHDGVTPPGMGWDGQSDGGGKFRLKRRRRCGQCGPCQVKENCNKCQYCMRKDVLKQACVYRKCVYLRKPVPRFRQEPSSAPSVQLKSAPTPPHKPTSTPVPNVPVSSVNSSSNSAAPNNGTSNNSSSTPLSNPSVASPTAVGAPISHAAELSSCRLTQSPFASMSAMQSMNNGALDPLRHRMMEPPHRSLFESMNHHPSLDPSRGVLDSSKAVMTDMSRFTGAHTAPGLGSHCKQEQPSSVVSQTTNMSTAAASLNSVNSALVGHHQPSKCPPSLTPRDPCFPTMDTWSSMPYALPHSSTWATQALPSHHVAAATYGFPQHTASFPSSFSPSSCQLGMPDPTASRFVPPTGPQHSFHHSMTMAGFSQDFAHAASNHSSHANMRTPMSPPFYPPPPHISPSSIHSFPGLSQFSAGQPSFAPTAYSMHPHAHMYPSSFYSFRAATEPQIYHVHVYPSHNPFKHFLQQIPFISHGEKDLNIKNTYSEFDFCGGIEISCDLLNEQYVNKCLSHKNNIDVPDKSLLLSSCLNDIKMLTSQYYKVNFSKENEIQIPCSPCDFDLVKDKHRLLNDSKKQSVYYTRKSNTHNTVYNSNDGCVVEIDEENSINSESGQNKKGCPKMSQKLSNIDQDLQDRLNLIFPNSVYHEFSCDDEDLFFERCSRTVEIESSITSDDEVDDGDDENNINSSLLKDRNHEQSVSHSPYKNLRPASEFAVGNPLSGLILQESVFFSSLHPAAIEARNVFTNNELLHENVYRFEHPIPSCRSGCPEHLHLNTEIKAERTCGCKLAVLKAENKSDQSDKSVDLPCTCQNLCTPIAAQTETLSFQTSADLIATPSSNQQPTAEVTVTSLSSNQQTITDSTETSSSNQKRSTDLKASSSSKQQTIADPTKTMK